MVIIQIPFLVMKKKRNFIQNHIDIIGENHWIDVLVHESIHVSIYQSIRSSTNHESVYKCICVSEYRCIRYLFGTWLIVYRSVVVSVTWLVHGNCASECRCINYLIGTWYIRYIIWDRDPVFQGILTWIWMRDECRMIWRDLVVLLLTKADFFLRQDC
jgi:hypothetical protein